MRLKLQSKRDLTRLVLVATLFAVVAPLVISIAVFSPIRTTMPEIFWGALMMAVLVPLMMTPPIAYLLFRAFLELNQSIERVDGHVKFDNLTGILNRGHFLDNVRASRVDGMMMIVDVDHFKAVNDELGHDAGDEVLKLLAWRLSNAVDIDGLVGRLGGEEFGIFLPECAGADATAMATRICEHVRQSLIPVGDVRIRLTVSIGGAFHKESAPLGHALKIADQRLYCAKDAGRDHFILEDSAAPAKVSPIKLKTVGI